MTSTTTTKYNVGGVLLDRPFKIRRLGHFGFNLVKMEEGVRAKKHEDESEEENRKLRRHLPGEHAIGEQLGGVELALRAQRRITRQEGRVDRAFAEDGPKIIGKEKRHDERIRQHAFAEDPRHQHVAHKPRDAGEQRKSADGEEAFVHQRRVSAISLRT